MSKKVGLDTLPIGWQDTIHQMFSEGCFESEIIMWIRENRTTGTFSMNLFNRWMIDEPEFIEVISMGFQACEAFWGKLLRKNINQRNFNSAAWNRVMITKFKWEKDTPSIHINTPRENTSNKTPEEILDMINEKFQMDRDKTSK